MIDLEQAIKKREAELDALLVKLQIPELTKILGDIKTLKASLEIVKQLSAQTKRETAPKPPPVQAAETTAESPAREAVNPPPSSSPLSAPPASPTSAKPIARAKPIYTSTGDAVAGILTEAGKPLSVEELLSEVEKHGFEPSHKSFRSLLMNDRRKRFEAADGGLIGLSESAKKE